MNNTKTNNDFYTQDAKILDELELMDEGSQFGLQKDEQLDAIGILVDLAKSGKIDPWNIDIVDVYDKYVTRLAELRATNLKLAGRGILFASILLKLKSNVLKGINVLDFDPYNDDENEFYDDYADLEDGEQLKIPTNNIISFAEVLQRRTSTRLNRSRNVTLKDLIRHLEFYEQLEKKKSLKNQLDKQKRRVRDYSKLSAKDIRNLAHEEYIEILVEKMRQNLTKILDHEEKIELKELSLLGFDRTSAYLAVLFLSARDSFEIVQEEFYGKLYVRRSILEDEETLSAS